MIWNIDLLHMYNAACTHSLTESSLLVVGLKLCRRRMFWLVVSQLNSLWFCMSKTITSKSWSTVYKTMSWVRWKPERRKCCATSFMSSDTTEDDWGNKTVKLWSICGELHTWNLVSLHFLSLVSRNLIISLTQGSSAAGGAQRFNLSWLWIWKRVDFLHIIWLEQ